MQFCRIIAFECILGYRTFNSDVNLHITGKQCLYVCRRMFARGECEGLTISSAPLMTPQRTLQYLRLLQLSGSSTKSTRGLSSKTCQQSQTDTAAPRTGAFVYMKQTCTAAYHITGSVVCIPVGNSCTCTQKHPEANLQ